MSMAFAKPFNRTSMELKQNSLEDRSFFGCTFNRTSMELKRGQPPQRRWGAPSF